MTRISWITIYLKLTFIENRRYIINQKLYTGVSFESITAAAAAIVVGSSPAANGIVQIDN